MKQRSGSMIGKTNPERYPPQGVTFSLRRLATLGMLIQTLLIAAPVLAQTETISQGISDKQEEVKEKDKENKKGNNELSYSQLLTLIRQKKVTDVQVDPVLQEARVTLTEHSEKDPPLKVPLFKNNPELIQALRENNIPFEVKPTADNSATVGLLVNLLLFLAVLGFLMMIIRRSANASGQAMNFGKSRARFQMESKTGIQFSDVAGIDEAKEELEEVVIFLKQPEKFTAVGAKIPKGVLLIGAPGTGKTLLAKAIAGEAGVPFFSISGSEFVEMFVGVGASRVRDLFKKAKEHAPCLVFIDEIDAVGRQRGVGYGGGNDEREQTLNQLLTEMDGFEGNNGIIVIAATNRPDVLDMALLRPGRFDRQITVDYPDYKGRLGILEVHARDKKMAPEVSLEAVARRTPGFTGADLANVLNEAAIFTARRRKEAMTMIEINDAIDRVAVGMEGKPMIDNKTKRMTAYHELGHAIVATLLKDHDFVEKVTLIPRGRALGITWFTPDEEIGMESRAKILAMIASSLGGRAADEVIFGRDEIDSGAESDIKRATRLARRMVTLFGMSELGYLALEQINSQFSGNDGSEEGFDYSQEIATKIDQQIRKISQEAYEKARNIILAHRPLMDYLVDILIDQETIEGDEFRRLVEKYKQKPLPISQKPLPVVS